MTSDTSERVADPASPVSADENAAPAPVGPDGDAVPPEEGAGEASPADELAQAKKELESQRDQYLRVLAELENTRRRCADDVVKAQKFGIERFARDLLPVMDSLEKALAASEEGSGALREGLEATHRQLLHVFEVSGLCRIEPRGGKFDPNTQQAMVMVPADAEHPAGTVAQVFQCGWTLSGRVLRPAMVSVAQA